MATQLNVNLTDASEYEMHITSVLTGHSLTDVVNRALQVYAQIERIRLAGGGIYVRNTVTGAFHEMAIH